MIKGQNPQLLPEKSRLRDVLRVSAENGKRLNESNIRLNACQEFLK